MRHTKTEHNEEHGTMQSYVIGFMLSLIFTFIPYYLVVNQTITGSILLIVILEFAVVQMIIQITFFLHLGRGPKPFWNVFFYVSTLSIIMVVVGGSVFIINNLNYNMSPADKTKKIVNDEGIYQVGGELTGACRQQYDNHIVTISNGLVIPSRIEASECDTLTFINEDVDLIKITFGEHDQHEAYAGEVEVIVKNGRNETITLSETGTYQFHDHLSEETAGEFTVNPL